MSSVLHVVMAQLNPVVGDLDGNVDMILQAATSARDASQATLIVYPELMLTGYPPEDLLLRPGFHAAIEKAINRLQTELTGIAAIIGFPESTAAGIYNSATLIHNGDCKTICRKHNLPNYSVFDEKRYFISGDGAGTFVLNDVCFGVTICEDIWNPEPARKVTALGAQCIININASPFHMHKQVERELELAARADENKLPVLYVNMTGGQDELVFDGQSVVMNADKSVTQRSPAFDEGLSAVTLAADGKVLTPQPAEISPLPDEVASVYQALVVGVHDYISKNGFDGVVIGLSGGIDSAVTLAVAVDALGAERVEAVSMPSRYTADMSVQDALAEAEALNVPCEVIKIEPVFKSFLTTLQPVFKGYSSDTTEENIQARCRGVILMAMANKKRLLVLTTGNKSEMAVGYATLYGDMAGGFDVLKDVPKMLVYALANYRNQQSAVIPQRVIDRPPSAELAEDQQDTDSLPEYPVLDEIVRRYIEEDESVADISAAGFNKDDVVKVARLIDLNEYKRRQAPPGVRISRRAFGRDRRYPITSRFRSH